ncbi:hypothetical protein B0H19DRAFT_1248157 [Mycena capillaripes]|nr:hypothetical protein B0H19DRAFT_1248157 [Mycena capillaripes]
MSLEAEPGKTDHQRASGPLEADLFRLKMTECFRLLDVPPELLVHILSFLPIDALHECRQASRFLFDFINTSIELKYKMATEVAGVSDNPSAPIPISDRLIKLQARETAFEDVDPSWRLSIPVTFTPSGLYELSGGKFWLGEHQRTALRYIELPSEPAEEDAPPVEWRRIPLPSSNSKIIDFGLAIDEHDLIVIATFTPTGVLEDNGELEGLVKLEFLTVSAPHSQHPQVRGPIDVQNSSWGMPNVILEIVGDHLVFVVGYAYATGDDRPEDRFYVYEWKTGKLKLEISAEGRTYFGAVFLSPEVIMLPNTTTATLELWSISSGQTTPTLTLHLPRLVPGVRIRTMTSRGEPNPAVSLRKDRRVPFHSSVEDSIIVFHINFPGPGPGLGPLFLLFIHRRSLLTLLATHTAGDTCSYAEWGPDICRWVNAAGLVMDWITTTSGQRCILLPMRLPTSLILLDFNPYKAHANPSHCIPPEDDPFVDYGIFAEPVGSRLPCHVRGSNEQFSSYSGVSLDDARVIAFRRNSLFRQISAVDIFYFG